MGFAFENFNAIGAFRAKDGDFPIDPAGVLPDGRSFKDPTALKALECQAARGLAHVLPLDVAFCGAAHRCLPFTLASDARFRKTRLKRGYPEDIGVCAGNTRSLRNGFESSRNRCV